MFEFDDVGKEIKNWAKIFAWVSFIGSIVAGVVMLLYGLGVLIADFDIPLSFGLIGGGVASVVFGYFLARLEVIILYGFGELIDQVTQINQRQQQQDLAVARKKIEAEKEDRKKQTEEGKPLVCKVCGKTIDREPCKYCIAKSKLNTPLEKTDMNWTCPKCGTKNLNSRKNCWRCEYEL